MKKIICFLIAFIIVCSLGVPTFAAGNNQFSRLRVGDIVEFGSYEQDNNHFNGKEPIRWIVVETFNNCIKLVSQYILDARAFDTSIWETSWENSEIRKWLNNEFYYTAFSYEERQIMELGKNHNQGGFYVSDRSDTYDMVWLMNIKEVVAYFGSGDTNRICYPTAYAKANGVYTGNYGSSWWWTRTPGEDIFHATYTGNLGNVDYKGNPVCLSSGGVRPVILVSTTRKTYAETNTFGDFGYSTYLFCSQCGSQIPSDSRFCKYCGHPVR